MELIRDKNGNVIQRSRNLAGIRKYVSTHIIKALAIDSIGKNAWEGRLSILFEDGSSFETNFASRSCLCEFVRRWRNVYGARLMMDGKDWGKVHANHPCL